MRLKMKICAFLVWWERREKESHQGTEKEFLDLSFPLGWEC